MHGPAFPHLERKNEATTLIEGYTMKLLRAIPLLLILGGALLLSSCGKADGSAADAKKNGTTDVHVKVTELAMAPFDNAILISGSVKAYDDVTISAEEGGVLKQWLKEKGQTVRKDEVIARIKDDILKAGYDAAEAQFKLSQMNFEKQDKVYGEQAISELQMKSTEFGRDAAKAQAALMKSRLDNTQIKSPIAGVLEERFVDAGEFAAPGMPVARVVNTARLKVTADVPETHADAVSRGMAVAMTFDAVPGLTVPGRVSYVGKTLSATNKTLSVEVAFPNPGGRVKPEMIAKLRLSLNGHREALLVDENAIMQVDRNRMVAYVVDKEKAAERIVTLGARQYGKVQVLTGLKPGDRLITTGYQKVVDGQPVVVVP